MDQLKRHPVRWAALILVLLLMAYLTACAPIAIPTASLPPDAIATPAGSPSASPVRIVRRNAEDLIMSLSDFPLTGYKMTIDETNNVFLRTRTFEALEKSASRPPYVSVSLAVSATAGEALEYYRNLEACTAVIPGSTENRVSAPAAGEKSFACVAIKDGARVYVLYVAYALGNVVVVVGLQPSLLTLDAALEQATTLARQQIDIVSRKAPPS